MWPNIIFHPENKTTQLLNTYISGFRMMRSDCILNYAVYFPYLCIMTWAECCNQCWRVQSRSWNTNTTPQQTFLQIVGYLNNLLLVQLKLFSLSQQNNVRSSFKERLTGFKKHVEVPWKGWTIQKHVALREKKEI